MTPTTEIHTKGLAAVTPKARAAIARFSIHVSAPLIAPMRRFVTASQDGHRHPGPDRSARPGGYYFPPGLPGPYSRRDWIDHTGALSGLSVCVRRMNFTGTGWNAMTVVAAESF
jgi:hypothetical protein